MPDSFDSPDGSTHSYSDGCNPAHVPEQAQNSVLCQSCTAEVPEEVQRMTRRLLASLDAQRSQRLAQAYGGQAPEMLCAGCMNVTVGTLNQAVVM